VTIKIKQLEVQGGRAPVPHSWRHQCCELQSAAVWCCSAFIAWTGCTAPL